MKYLESMSMNKLFNHIQVHVIHMKNCAQNV
ncbi:unnamed protein product [Schistosoma curassoni]|uniref:Uncharacterized protein n=1 Tax=Schistosoma curassoni TaxID=6186 RepID=A0A183JPD4_9TREM|nr:unnamed protein product [Schistosoma curassoni]